MIKKGIVLGISAMLLTGVNVYAVDINDAINGAMESTGNMQTEVVTFAEVDFDVPINFIKDESSTEDQLKYATEDQQVTLTFYNGDYKNGADEFRSTKKDIVSNIVAGTEDGELLSTEDCTMAGFDGIRFDFSSNVDGTKHLSNGAYFYNETKEKYIIAILSAPEGFDASGYQNQYNLMIQNAKINDNFFEVYADMMHSYGDIINAINEDNYGDAMSGLGDLYSALGQLE